MTDRPQRAFLQKLSLIDIVTPDTSLQA